MHPINSFFTAAEDKTAIKLSAKRQLFAAVIGWLLLTACLTYLNRNYFHAELFETGDFAADSLLIQQAKQFHLWTGHYSRFGFNHPGPAILDALAIGEWLLFDHLHLTQSPIAGQIFAAGAYNAFWLAAIGLLFFRMPVAMPVAALNWLAFTAMTAYVDHTIFSGIWPPHLFYLPFATFTLALMRLLCGKGDSILILTLSAGVLVHGHAAFIAMCGLMLIGTLALNHRLALRDLDVNRVCSQRFCRDHRFALTLAAFLALLFILPLAIETIRHFPGPLYQYATYGGRNKHNDVGNALVFVAQFWSFGLTPLLVGVLAIFFFGQGNAQHQVHARTAKCQTYLLLISTAAVLCYAIAGIDDLKMIYLGLFYYSTPAIALALMFGNMLPSSKPKTNTAIVVLLALAALPFIYRQAAKPADYAVLYHDEKIPLYFDKIANLGNTTAVLDFDQQSNWGRIWSTMVAVQVYAARHGRPELFCINKNWHVLFTLESRCTAEQLENLPRLFVSTARSDDTLGSPALSLDDINFYKLTTPKLQLGRNYRIDSDKMLFASALLNAGWSSPETDFVWTENQRASIVFRIEPTPASALELDIGAYLPRENSTQIASVFIDGRKIGSLSFSKSENRGIRTIPLRQLSTGAPITLQFEIPNPSSPRENRQGEDGRKLGIALYGMKLLP